MAIAAVPEPPRDRWERVGWVLILVATVVIASLFVFSMLDAYVF